MKFYDNAYCACGSDRVGVQSTIVVCYTHAKIELPLHTQSEFFSQAVKFYDNDIF